MVKYQVSHEFRQDVRGLNQESTWALAPVIPTEDKNVHMLKYVLK